MKFRLKTLFALTAVAGVWFFLARPNPWLPVLLAVMFGPATVAFAVRRPWTSQAATASLVVILGTMTALALTASSSRSILDGPPEGNCSLYGDHVEIRIAPYDREEEVAAADIFDFGLSNFKVVHTFYYYTRFWVWVEWHVIVGAPFVYGITLQLLAWWLERRKARA